MRFTITRAVSGFSLLVMLWANSSLPLPFVNLRPPNIVRRLAWCECSLTCRIASDENIHIRRLRAILHGHGAERCAGIFDGELLDLIIDLLHAQAVLHVEKLVNALCRHRHRRHGSLQQPAHFQPRRILRHETADAGEESLLIERGNIGEGLRGRLSGQRLAALDRAALRLASRWATSGALAANSRLQ